MPKPSIGRIVHYTLSAAEAQAINALRRNSAAGTLSMTGSAPTHLGNRVQEGDVFPLVITRVWNENPGTINGQVLLDGNDTHWVTSRTPGDGPGFYAWPTRD